MKKAIVLLSGGLDSTVALYYAKSLGFEEIYALSFKYGQKHSKELDSALKIGEKAGVKEHKIVELMLNQWNGSSLTDDTINIEDGDIESKEIPNTYVPARNMVFLSVAAPMRMHLEYAIFLLVSAKWIIRDMWIVGKSL